MTEVSIIEDEAWPTYYLHDEGERRVEVDPDVLERWKFVLAQYLTVQEEMAALYDDNPPPPRPATPPRTMITPGAEVTVVE